MTRVVVGVLMVPTFLAASCGGDDDGAGSTGTSECGFEDGVGCADASARVDLTTPTFGDPTSVTNPLFPMGELDQVVQLGEEEGSPGRVEVTLLPETRTIDWDGTSVEAIASQFIAYRDGRVVEIAVDYFAQADDGAVWYLGEDVKNYEDGAVADTEGSWLAGDQGPAGMIMPADPQVGDVYRSENIPGFVFEEDTVTSVTETLPGPRGPVAGVVLVQEHLMDNDLEDKAFAPGYGEFRVHASDEDFSVAIAVPTDAAAGAEPPALAELSAAATDVFEQAASGDWAAAAATAGDMATAWTAADPSSSPELLVAQMDDALDSLEGAIEGEDAPAAQQAALDVDRASLDLQLAYRPVAEVDLGRVGAWARQLLLDTEAADPGAAASDVVALTAIRDRSGQAWAADVQERVDARLGELRAAVDDEDLPATSEVAAALLQALESGAGS